MTNNIIHSILVILVLSIVTKAYSQQVPVKNWDVEKIKGVRQLPYSFYTGFPYLTDTWVLGKIELDDGVIIDSLFLKYSSYKDELIYYNNEALAPIKIDKQSLNGFVFTDAMGNHRVFRKLYYDNFEKGDRFFEVLSDGETKLLAYRKVNLEQTSPYTSENGIVKNMCYNLEYSYYFYAPQKGYTSVKINQSSLLAKFNKDLQKTIKKLLRKNRIKIYNEADFIHAWNVVEKEGYKIAF